MPLTAAERAVNVKIETEWLHHRRDDVPSRMRDGPSEHLLLGRPAAAAVMRRQPSGLLVQWVATMT